MSIELFFPHIMAFFLTILFIHLLIPAATHIGLMDHACDRKHHLTPTPLVGGIGIFMGFSLSILQLPISLYHYRSLFAACILIFITGLLDDMRELSSYSRMLSQILIAFILFYLGNIQLLSFGDILFFGDINLGYLSILVTIIAVSGIINATNMLDGVDGLSGSNSIVQLSFLGYITYSSNLMDEFSIIMLIVSAILGFLCFNFPFPGRKNAHVFMGDNGSLLIGLFIVWFLIDLSQNDKSIASPVMMLWIMAFPLFDTISVMFQRIIQKSSPFKADRKHLHHLLLKLGYKPIHIVIVTCTISFLFGSTGIVLNNHSISDSISFLLYLLSSIIFLTYKIYLSNKKVIF